MGKITKRGGSMKKIFLAWIVCLVTAVCSIGALQLQQNKNSAEAMPSAEQVVQYIVKLYNGRIAVFTGGEEIPVKYLEIDVSNLREYDKKQFETGIVLNTLKEVFMLEEDFSS